MKWLEKSSPPKIAPMIGMMISSVRLVAIFPNAAPMITATARSSTLPLAMKVRNSLSMRPSFVQPYSADWQHLAGGCQTFSNLPLHRLASSGVVTVSPADGVGRGAVLRPAGSPPLYRTRPENSVTHQRKHLAAAAFVLPERAHHAASGHHHAGR